MNYELGAKIIKLLFGLRQKTHSYLNDSNGENEKQNAQKNVS